MEPKRPLAKDARGRPVVQVDPMSTSVGLTHGSWFEFRNAVYTNVYQEPILARPGTTNPARPEANLAIPALSPGVPFSIILRGNGL